MQRYGFAIKTFGCKVNRYESQIIRENLIRMGFYEVSPDEADVIVLNTCTVTHQADSKTRQFIRKAKKARPSARIFVTGCFAVLNDDIKALESMKEVFMVVPKKEKESIFSGICGSFGEPFDLSLIGMAASHFRPQARAFLKVQDGCDQKCSYCKVNLVRGPSRSRDETEILDEFKRYYASGHREIVVTGICLGSWKGRKGEGLARLIDNICSHDGDFRIRLSSIEPNHIDGELIRSIKHNPKVCKHLHIPLQSGSDNVLKAMGRRYGTEQFVSLISSIRKSIPYAGISMDIIAGFPGETPDDFNYTRDLLRVVRPSRLHVFRYSEREGTPAFALSGKVPPDEAKKRVEALIRLGKEFQIEFCKSFIGKEVTILAEDVRGNVVSGYTGEYVRAEFTSADARKGELVDLVPDSIDIETATLRA
ncbi:MAG: tRNA (N(6)-L-threonylcarbamoyladenosine(37)-C(2))-methylthiotransferase MtaB [Candidatus Omnitrophica bacterium]|nr:tRNA (N(6)-L-threonylcarbamoyladenosine(37)-C(2))-methylthiotransferase MtaB [Candidatus Omnitrophota bacterium]